MSTLLLTSRALLSAQCFVVTVIMLVSAPGIVQAETRQECITRVEGVFNNRVTNCATGFTGNTMICEDDRVAEYNDANADYQLMIDLINGVYDDQFNQCNDDDEIRKTRCEADETRCYENVQVLYTIAIYACVLSSDPFCEISAYMYRMYARSQCESARLFCEINSSILRNSCVQAAEEQRNDDSLIESNQLTGRVIAAEWDYVACLAGATSDYLACVLQAAQARQDGLLACPTGGHGAPPAGHGAPPPPAGHGAPPPPSGHGAP